MRTIAFTRTLGTCVLHAVPPPPTVTGVSVACPLRVDRLGALLVSMQAHLTQSATTAHSLRLLGHDIIPIRGTYCIVACILPVPAAERSSVGVSSSRKSSIQLHLRRVLHALESHYSPQLRLLCEHHQRLVDDLVQRDTIQHQRDEATAEDALQLADAQATLANTRTIPLLAHFEQFVHHSAHNSNFAELWFTQLMPTTTASTLQLPAAPLIIGAFLLAPATVGATSACTVLQSSLAPAFAALNIAGPGNAKLWTVVCAHVAAIALREERSPVALSFTTISPPLIVHFQPVTLPLPAPHAQACLVAYEIGRVASPVAVPKPAVQPLGVQWLSAAEAVLEADRHAATTPLLHPDHPVAVEARQHPQGYTLVRDASLLPAWHTQQRPDDEEKEAFAPRVWHRLQEVSHSIQRDLSIDDAAPSAMIAPIALSVSIDTPISPPSVLSPVVTVTPPLPSPSPLASMLGGSAFDSPPRTCKDEEEEKHAEPSAPALFNSRDRLLWPAPLERDETGDEEHKTSEPQNPEDMLENIFHRALRPNPSPPTMPHPPPQPRPSSAHLASTVPLDLGASFHGRKMRAVTIVGPATNALNVVFKPRPPSSAPIHPLASPILPVPPLPLSRGGSDETRTRIRLRLFTGTPPLPCEQADQAVEMNFDTPRLATEVEAQTSRLTSARGSVESSFFPPLDRRTSDAAHATTLEQKLLLANRAATAAVAEDRTNTAF